MVSRVTEMRNRFEKSEALIEVLDSTNINMKSVNIVFKGNCRRIHSLYDPILYSFMISGIDLFESNDKKLRNIRCIFKHLYYALSIVSLLTGIVQFCHLCAGINLGTLTAGVFYNAMLVLRLAIYKKRKSVIKLLKMLAAYKLPIEPDSSMKRAKLRLSFVCFSVILIIKISMICSICLLLILNGMDTVFSENPKFDLFLRRIHPKARIILNILLVITVYLWSLLPFSLFTILLASVSWHLKILLKDTKKVLKLIPVDFNSFQSCYSSVSRLVNFTDAVFKPLVLLSMVQVSVILYANTFRILKGVLPLEVVSWLSVSTAVVHFLLFAIASTFAADIPAANEDIVKAINNVPYHDSSAARRIVVTLQVQQGLYLTAGGIINIKRGLAWSLIGTIFTYSVLMESLWKD